MKKHTLLLTIPAYNEAEIIEATVRRVWSVLAALPNIEPALCVVDNASTDETAARVRALDLPATVVVIPTKGKGVAIVHAAREGGESDFFGFIDADLSADPDHILTLLDPLCAGRADIAVGSRLLNKGSVTRSWWRTYSSECFNLLRRLLLNTPVRDSQCGLKLMNRRGRAVLAQCRETGWFLDMEFLARAHQEKLRVAELPVTWDEYRYPHRRSKLHLFRDGIAALVAMWRIRWRIRS